MAKQNKKLLSRKTTRSPYELSDTELNSHWNSFEHCWNEVVVNGTKDAMIKCKLHLMGLKLLENQAEWAKGIRDWAEAQG